MIIIIIIMPILIKYSITRLEYSVIMIRKVYQHVLNKAFNDAINVNVFYLLENNMWTVGKSEKGQMFVQF